MPVVAPYIPRTITVHLGPPDSNAANVTVPFSDYVKNVASSEIYPTWDESALRANILAIISFALNRVYTEFYRSRGYDFDITNSTAYDQAFVNGRGFFDNISRLVDELLTSYLRRPGFVEPLAAKFCNGTTVTCDGLSQWGSQNLARQGYSAPEILNSYYGNVEIVPNAPVRSPSPSYPGTPLRRGSQGSDVTVIQVALNRIAQNYPAIPRLDSGGRDFRPPDGGRRPAVPGDFRSQPRRHCWPRHLERHRPTVHRRDPAERAAEQGPAILCHQLCRPRFLQWAAAEKKSGCCNIGCRYCPRLFPPSPPPRWTAFTAVVPVPPCWRPSASWACRRRGTWTTPLGRPFIISIPALKIPPSGPERTSPSKAGQRSRPWPRQGRTPEKTALTQFPGKDLALGSRDPVVREVVR